MKSCWLKLLVLFPAAWWLASCDLTESPHSQRFGLTRADADEPAIGPLFNVPAKKIGVGSSFRHIPVSN